MPVNLPKVHTMLLGVAQPLSATVSAMSLDPGRTYLVMLGNWQVEPPKPGPTVASNGFTVSRYNVTSVPLYRI
jgi:hypothetical protein